MSKKPKHFSICLLQNFSPLTAEMGTWDQVGPKDPWQNAASFLHSADLNMSVTLLKFDM